MPDIASQRERFAEQLKSMTESPGVYRMLGENETVLYVGKARNLKKRVSSYFTKSNSSPRTQHMVRQAEQIAISVTRTEGEALLLESQLIKSLKPRYNVLLRDDKSYPYISLSSSQTYPRIGFHRGAKRKAFEYFGPFPSAGAVRESLDVIQKVFRLRNCRDSYFRNRSRPCLQYQIKRCTAPCVGYISAEDYQRSVEDARLFLNGQSSALIETLIERMETASVDLDFEYAAQCRDQIAALKRIQARQYVESGGDADADVIACAVMGQTACVQVIAIRNGQNLGNRAFYPRIPRDSDDASVLNEFLARYYADRQPPDRIYLPCDIEDRSLLADAFGAQRGRKVRIIANPRGERRRWLDMALENAQVGLRGRVNLKQNYEDRFQALESALEASQPIERMECFDISHTRGEATVASCVVFNREGALKSDYRRFNIKDVAAGDDYAAMHQALLRRYRRLRDEGARLPNLVIVDGGKGQLREAMTVFAELELDGLPLIGVSKGPDRRPGDEEIHVPGQRHAQQWPADSPALLLLQEIRDEAHRFAIGAHRQRRGKARTGSVLDEIEGVGAKRRAQLLKYFGGLRGLKAAGREELAAVPGISAALAERIHRYFHD